MTAENMWIIGGVWTVAVSVLGGGAFIVSKFSLLSSVLTRIDISLVGLTDRLDRFETDVNKRFDEFKNDVKDDFHNVDKEIDEIKVLREEVATLKEKVMKAVTEKDLRSAMTLFQTQFNDIESRLKELEIEHRHHHGNHN